MFSRGTVFRSFLWKFLEKCSVQLTGFIITILLARILNPEDYGLIALVIVFVNLTSVFVDGGLNTALVQKKNADQLDFSTIFYTSIAVSVLFYILLYIFAPAIARFYDNTSLIPILRVLGVTLIFYAINSIQKAFLVKKLLFKKLFYSSFGAVIISGLAGIVMAKYGFGVWALVTQSILSQLAVTIIMWATVKWRPTLEFSFDRFRSLFDFGWKIFASNLLITAFLNIRSLIIGKVYNAKSLALFDRGKQFPAFIVENINSSIQAVLFPVLSESQDDKESVKAMVRRSIKTSALIIFPVLFGLSILAGPIVRCLLTDKWLGAVPFIQIFCLAYLFMPMQIANVEAIKSLGYSGTNLKIEILKKAVELAILIITIPISVQAIAIGIVAYNMISLFINARPNQKFLNYGAKEQIRDILPSLAISSMMGVILIGLLFVPVSPGWIIVMGIVFGIFAYISFNILFRVESFRYLINVVRPKVKQLYTKHRNLSHGQSTPNDK